MPDLDPAWCVWAADGDWESAAEDSVQDARDRTRAEAQHRYSYGEVPWIEARVWKRYIAPIPRQDQWEYHVETNSTWDDEPETPPDDWVPSDWDPVWKFVWSGAEGAIPVWICGVKGDDPPQNPKRDVT